MVVEGRPQWRVVVEGATVGREGRRTRMEGVLIGNMRWGLGGRHSGGGGLCRRLGRRPGGAGGTRFGAGGLDGEWGRVGTEDVR